MGAVAVQAQAIARLPRNWPLATATGEQKLLSGKPVSPRTALSLGCRGTKRVTSNGDQLDKIGAGTGKRQSELVRGAIAACLDKTEPASVEKMSRKLSQLEKQIKALILIQGD